MAAGKKADNGIDAAVRSDGNVHQREGEGIQCEKPREQVRGSGCACYPSRSFIQQSDFGTRKRCSEKAGARPRKLVIVIAILATESKMIPELVRVVLESWHGDHRQNS